MILYGLMSPFILQFSYLGLSIRILGELNTLPNLGERLTKDLLCGVFYPVCTHFAVFITLAVPATGRKEICLK